MLTFGIQDVRIPNRHSRQPRESKPRRPTSQLSLTYLPVPGDAGRTRLWGNGGLDSRFRGNDGQMSTIPRQYTSMVDTGSTYLALPLEEIDALGMEGGDWGTVMLVSATGPVEVDTYFARGELMGKGSGRLWFSHRRRFSNTNCCKTFGSK